MNYIALSLLCFNIFCFASSNTRKVHRKRPAIERLSRHKGEQEKQRSVLDLTQPEDVPAEIVSCAKAPTQSRRINRRAAYHWQQKIQALDNKILTANLRAESHRLERMLLEDEFKAEQKFRDYEFQASEARVIDSLPALAIYFIVVRGPEHETEES